MTEASNNEKVQVVKWENFNQNIDKFVKSQIIKDEYIESRAVEGIEELLFRYLRTSFWVNLEWRDSLYENGLQSCYKHLSKV